MDFVSLRKGNHKLAAALGACSKRASPYNGHDLLDWLAKCRNDMVDRYIHTAQHESDPMADVDVQAVQQEIPGTERTKLFHQVKVPHILELQCNGFCTPQGKRIAPHTLKVVSTPKRNMVVSIEASPANFDWLVHALQHTWMDDQPQPSSPGKRKLNDELEEIGHIIPEHVRVVTVDKNTVRLWASIYKGKYTRATKTIRRSEHPDLESFKCAVETVSKHVLSVQAECSKHGECDDGENEGI